VVADGSVVLFSGNGANITHSLPEIAAALLDAVRREAVIRDVRSSRRTALGFHRSAG
jgi:ATP-dependent DNA ligase